ncbi:hypothetical protein BXY70_1311 [Roseovarius halotolerans]|uniref:Lipoprotein n=1 Tax=Roseovarius halotolerans TaxID=505353 RepID=A0A1X6Y600_9RHOB|nr:hypothetical protein [Roseovarius halotolerans]RKT35278.1 hypothetical protein BXY70_1311 [Roseovarius halotolerans]SLN11313.1 hypothetical protein ROH8110_00085 [Roseovarius halotolerans]
MRALVIISALALAGCAQPEPILDRLPVQVATCPNPEERARLLEGSTFRDLARSRAEALTGWEECFNAARENGEALQ